MKKNVINHNLVTMLRRNGNIRNIMKLMQTSVFIGVVWYNGNKDPDE